MTDGFLIFLFMVTGRGIIFICSAGYILLSLNLGGDYKENKHVKDDDEISKLLTF